MINDMKNFTLNDLNTSPAKDKNKPNNVNVRLGIRVKLQEKFLKKQLQVNSVLTKESNTNLFSIKSELSDIGDLLSKQPKVLEKAFEKSFEKALKKVVSSIPQGNGNNDSGFSIDDLPERNKKNKKTRNRRGRSRTGRNLANVTESITENIPTTRIGKLGKAGKGLLKKIPKIGGLLGIADVASSSSEINSVKKNKGGKLNDFTQNALGFGIPGAAIAAGGFGLSLMNDAYDDVSTRRKQEQESKGLRDPQTFSELFDRMLGDTTSTTVKNQKILSKTGKEFVKTEKSLETNNKELKKTTEEIKDFDVKDFFGSIGDKISGAFKQAVSGVEGVLDSAKLAVTGAFSQDNGYVPGSHQPIGTGGVGGIGEPEGDIKTRPLGKTKVSSDQKGMMKNVYSAFTQAGFSEAQAKALTAEVGRENAYNPKNVFGTHTDAANGATNTGFFSWQGNRSEKLQKRLAEKGLMKNGKMDQSQESLNEMAKFAKEEMESGQYKGLGNFMENKNVDSETAAKQLGKGYIKWAYGQDKLRSGKSFDWRSHDTRRAGYYNQLEGILGSNTSGTTQQERPNSVLHGDENKNIPASIQNVNDQLMQSTQDAIDKGVKYNYGSKKSSSGSIDCSGWIMEINGQMSEQLTDKDAIKPTIDAMKQGASQQGAAGIIQAVGQQTGKELSGADVNANNLKEGMVIGIDHSQGGAKSGEGRYKGIDHIVQVVRDPKTGELAISESSSKKGVHTTDANEWLQRNAKKPKYAVDPYDALRNDSTQVAKIEKENQPLLSPALETDTNKEKQATVINNVNNVSNNTNIAKGGSNDSSLPLITRNPLSSIQAYNLSLMSNSVS